MSSFTARYRRTDREVEAVRAGSVLSAEAALRMQASSWLSDHRSMSVTATGLFFQAELSALGAEVLELVGDRFGPSPVAPWAVA